MSKRYTYRRYRRTYPKQKWQMTVVNPEQIYLTLNGFAANTFYAIHKRLCQTVVPTDAAAQAVVSSNNIVKVGNFKVKGTIMGGNSEIPQISAIIYAIFVPQGITPDNNAVSTTNLATSLFYSHPEWVLCWTRKDVLGSDSNNFSMSSRLKRNLNSGDSIQLGVIFINETSTAVPGNVGLIVQATAAYYARAN